MTFFRFCEFFTITVKFSWFYIWQDIFVTVRFLSIHRHSPLHKFSAYQATNYPFFQKFYVSNRSKDKNPVGKLCSIPWVLLSLKRTLNLFSAFIRGFTSQMHYPTHFLSISYCHPLWGLFPCLSFSNAGICKEGL